MGYILTEVMNVSRVIIKLARCAAGGTDNTRCCVWGRRACSRVRQLAPNAWLPFLQRCHRSSRYAAGRPEPRLQGSGSRSAWIQKQDELVQTRAEHFSHGMADTTSCLNWCEVAKVKRHLQQPVSQLTHDNVHAFFALRPRAWLAVAFLATHQNPP